jgi:peroxiredoxin
MMKTTLLSLALLAFTFGLAQPAAALTAVGETAPDFTLSSLDGKASYTLSELRGQVVYLDFWASWCGPCRRSFPEVQALHAEYKDRPFRVLAVSIDRKAADGIKFLEAQQVGFPSVFDEGGKVATRFGVQSIPSAFVIGPDGKIAHSAVGFDPRGLPQLKAKIEGLLSAAEAGAKAKQPASRAEAGKTN